MKGTAISGDMGEYDSSIAEIGHKDVKVTMLYAHLSSGFLAEQLNRLKF